MLACWQLHAAEACPLLTLCMHSLLHTVAHYRHYAFVPAMRASMTIAKLCQVGAEELAPEEYKAASELRARLTSAARVKQQLEAALRGLALAAGRQPDEAAEAVEAAIKEAAR